MKYLLIILFLLVGCAGPVEPVCYYPEVDWPRSGDPCHLSGALRCTNGALLYCAWSTDLSHLPYEGLRWVVLMECLHECTAAPMVCR